MISTSRTNNKSEFRCYYQDCRKVFLNKIYLVTHINSQHLQIPVFKCEVCETFFNSLTEFSNHEQIHLNKPKEFEDNSYFLSKITDETCLNYSPPSLISLPILPGIESDRRRFAYSYKIPISVKIFDLLSAQDQRDVI